MFGLRCPPSTLQPRSIWRCSPQHPPDIYPSQTILCYHSMRSCVLSMSSLVSYGWLFVHSIGGRFSDSSSGLEESFFLVVCDIFMHFWHDFILLSGMVEKAMFTAEYQNIHDSGKATQGLIVAAEIVSCAKRSIARFVPTRKVKYVIKVYNFRILVIIVCLGYGIVKPRLGPTLHRVVFVGGLYFLLATIESVFRVIHPKNDPANKALLAAVPLAVIDASICWWVFSALVATTRQLRLRRNLVKLSVYKHFANTLIFSIISSIIFMLWSIKYHKVVDCLTQWKDLWVDDAFWHLLFSVILCVIMVLWRPSKNNQRYKLLIKYGQLSFLF